MRFQLAFACVAALTCSAAADEIVIEPDRDNTIFSESEALSNGAGNHFFCGKNQAGDTRRALLRFDVAGAAPAGAQIESVRLDLFMSRTDTGPFDYNLHRVTADWGEGTSDAPGNEGGGAFVTPNDATWLHTFFDSGFWQNPGGDFNPVSSAVQTVNLEGPYSFGPSDGLRDDVQAWLDNPKSNFGWIMIDPPSGPFATSKRFDSRHLPDATKRPKLVITFSAGVVGDLTGDGMVNGADLANLLAQWGTDGPADFNNSGAVDGSDLAFLLANWT